MCPQKSIDKHPTFVCVIQTVIRATSTGIDKIKVVNLDLYLRIRRGQSGWNCGDINKSEEPFWYHRNECEQEQCRVSQNAYH